MSSVKTIKLPANLNDDLDLKQINVELRSHTAQLDWSDVVEADQENLSALLAGLDLSDDADILGIDGAMSSSVAEAVSQFFEQNITRKQSRSKVARKRSGKQPELWTSSTTSDGTEGQDVDETGSSVNAADSELSTMNPPKTLAASLPSAYEIRAKLETAILNDLLGPAAGDEEEVFENNVNDRYLVGMLAPKQNSFELPEADDEYAIAGDDTSPDGKVEADVPIAHTMFPSSLGITFSVRGDINHISVQGGWGQYERVRSKTVVQTEGKGQLCWRRTPIRNSTVMTLKEGPIDQWIIDPKYPEVYIQGLTRKQGDDWIVTLFMVNSRAAVKKLRDTAWVFQPEINVESSDPDDPDIFVCKPQHRKSDESLAAITEDRAIAMLYRKQREFAVGHGVGTKAEVSERTVERAKRISTQIVPAHEVPKTTPPLAEEIPGLSGLVLDMKELAESSSAQLADKLVPLTSAYADWIEKQRKKLSDPAELLDDFQGVADEVLKNCSRTLERIEQGVELLKSDESAAAAFKFMNKAMWLQRVRSTFAEQRRRGNKVELSQIDIPKNRTWYPFQLAFVLLNLPSLTDVGHESRIDPSSAIADLLWFPTGGGKTEAYLGLTAFTLAIRRLQGNVAGRSGEFGVAVLMRYTLRLLTLQQFQRASALICACESIRREANANGDGRWGKEPFRIGLWVGLKTTPNKTSDADEFTKRARGQFYPGSSGTPHQLNNCPWCGHKIDDGQNIKVETFERGRGRTLIFCGDPFGSCLFTEKNSPDEGLPVLVVDEEIYRRLPSLLIATVDKFAQMPWKGPVEMLFGQVDGYCERHGFRSPDLKDTDSHNRSAGLPAAKTIPHGPLRPPDLIIQDELHLISGPLGTLVGLYETAVDKLATWEFNGKRIRPKVIASTATIRQSENQVKNLFLRKVQIFPPQGLDVDDNFFSRQRKPHQTNPGRRYIGICASGRRLKAALIRVYVALLAAAQAQYENYGFAADPWMTLVGYFNSLRELGGMRRLVDDDVKTRLLQMDRRGLVPRKRLFVDELTSRKSSTDIPQILDQLEMTFDPAALARVAADKRAGKKVATLEPLDVILATNMVSVGVDVKRLGVMVVAGQPKTTAEYIQATSRVGRSFPGLVITVYNWARPRDLSHYESFEHYHAAFYQHVEALSVTPFSFGSIDRGLSALLVGLIRLFGKEFNANSDAANLERNHPFVKAAVETIERRAWEIGGTTTRDYLSAEIERKLDIWLDYANDRTGGRRLGYESKKDGLTVGLLKDPYAARWEDFTCLRSLRNVEPTVGLMLVDDNSNSELSRTPQPMPQEDGLNMEAAE
jgi:Helicase conserved C-terminal domain